MVNVFRFNKDELRNCRAIGQVSSSFLAYLNAFLQLCIDWKGKLKQYPVYSPIEKSVRMKIGFLKLLIFSVL